MWTTEIAGASVEVMGDDFAKDMGARLRQARERCGKTQQELAFEAGIRVQSISDYENGRHKASAEVVGKLASALGVNLMWLFYGTSEKTYEPNVSAEYEASHEPEPALIQFLSTRLGQTATDAEIASLLDLTAYNGRATPETYAHMLTVLRTTVEPDPEAEARFQASGYMRSSLDRFKKK